MGDIRLSSGIKLRQKPSKNQLLTLRLGIELPTGDSSKLLGSDSYDFYAYLSSQQKLVSSSSLIVYGGLGGLYSTQGKILQEEKKDYVTFVLPKVEYTPENGPTYILKDITVSIKRFKGSKSICQA